MVDINSTLSVIIQDVNSLNAPIKDRLSERAYTTRPNYTLSTKKNKHFKY